MNGTGMYGLLAQFNTPDEILRAAKQAYGHGYRKMDAYSPFHVEGLADAIGFKRNGVALITLIGGLMGGLTGFGLQYWINVLNYPLNIAGKPLDSWVAYIIVTFELTVLGASLFGTIGMLALNGLPMPYHPLFNVDEFSMVTRDKFFLAIEAVDPLFERDKTEQFLLSLEPQRVWEVPN